jgi:hypothetical protein
MRQPDAACLTSQKSRTNLSTLADETESDNVQRHRLDMSLKIIAHQFKMCYELVMDIGYATREYWRY